MAVMTWMRQEQLVNLQHQCDFARANSGLNMEWVEILAFVRKMALVEGIHCWLLGGDLLKVSELSFQLKKLG